MSPYGKTFNLINRLKDPLRLIIPSNTRPPRITAAAGTELAGTSSLSNIIILLSERVLQPNWQSSPTWRRWITLSCIVQDS